MNDVNTYLRSELLDWLQLMDAALKEMNPANDLKFDLAAEFLLDDFDFDSDRGPAAIGAFLLSNEEYLVLRNLDRTLIEFYSRFGFEAMLSEHTGSTEHLNIRRALDDVGAIIPLTQASDEN